MSEHGIQSQIQLALSRGDVRLFRNNVGTGWVGKIVTAHGVLAWVAAKLSTTIGNIKILMFPRPLHAGLITGSADLIGWKTVTVTPDMVGQKLAVFMSVEVKDTNGRPRPEQIIWYDNVRLAGGIAIIAHSVEEAKEKVK